VALVAALAGTAVASDPVATSSAINKKKVKKIANKQINAAAPTLSVASADTADIASNLYSANVLANGTMLGSIPDGATSSKTALGTYNVGFGRDMTGCTISASAANNTDPQPAIVAIGVLNATTLRVFTRSSANAVTDQPFYAQAICPAG
jgi:hypothetical protein